MSQEQDNTTRRIQSIKIEGLFELFDYDIVFPENENVLIITGANGFGKTQLLNIVFNLFNRNFNFFPKLTFNTIIINFPKSISIKIIKKIERSVHFINFILLENEEIKSVIKYRGSKVYTGLVGNQSKSVTYSGTINSFPKRFYYNIFGEDKEQKKDIHIDDLLSEVNVHLIKEQRLFKKISTSKIKDNNEQEQTVMIETIQTHAGELKGLIDKRYEQLLDISQSLDRTYATRLIGEKSKISEIEYTAKFTVIQNKQKLLAINGLYNSTQDDLPYSKDDAKALLVYLNDLEQKLGVFDDLLEKLDLFTSILNERRFNFKSIQIDREKGFYFQTDKGNNLALTDLSSGEQHEVVLFYELIFNTKSRDIVLIDEPEISLHITWQKEFLEDLLKIVKMQQIQVIVATHSPSIINDRWDLVYTLTKKQHAAERPIVSGQNQ